MSILDERMLIASELLTKLDDVSSKHLGGVIDRQSLARLEDELQAAVHKWLKKYDDQFWTHKFGRNIRMKAEASEQNPNSVNISETSGLLQKMLDADESWEPSLKFAHKP